MKTTTLISNNTNIIKTFKKYLVGVEVAKEDVNTTLQNIVENTNNLDKGQMVVFERLIHKGTTVKTKELNNRDIIVWDVIIGYNTGEEAQLFSGRVKGFYQYKEDSSNIEDIFIPLGCDKTISELNNPKYNSRKRAIDMYLANISTISTKLNIKEKL